MLAPLTIREAAAAMREGRLTPVELLEQCLERVDHYESRVAAWVVIDRAGAQAQALKLTDELNAGHDRGPLHGIPVGVKDIIDVCDLPTAAGSKLWANSLARRDAAVVTRLRAAGAVILGKTVTTAYAFIDPPPTRNPWDLSRTPGGSSSGSAAAVACGMCLAAIGTQTAGSLTRPAAFCGVCALKPGLRMLPDDGVLPLAPTFDRVGIIAGCVADLRLVYDAAADSGSHIHPRNRPGELIRPGGVFQSRLSGEMAARLDAVSELLRADGMHVREQALPAAFAGVWGRHRIIMATEAAAVHADRLRRDPDDYPPRVRALIEEGAATPAPEYYRATVHRNELRQEYDHALSGTTLLTAAAPGAAPDLTTTGDAVLNLPWNYLEKSTVSLPAGRDSSGLPLAVQLVGDVREVGELLATAEWVESRLGWQRRVPD